MLTGGGDWRTLPLDEALFDGLSEDDFVSFGLAGLPLFCAIDGLRRCFDIYDADETDRGRTGL